MKFYPKSFLFLLLCVAAVGAGAQVAQPREISVFRQHPTHCAVLVGGPDYLADGADRAYGESLAAAVSSLGGSASAALSQIHNACLARQVLSTDPDRPKSPTSS